MSLGQTLQILQTQPLKCFHSWGAKHGRQSEARSDALSLFSPPVHFLLSCLAHTLSRSS